MPPFPKIFGTTTVTEKGQIVIPVEARNAMGLEPGAKVLVMGGGPDGNALIIMTTAHAETLLAGVTDRLASIRALTKDPDHRNMENGQ